MTNWNDTRLAYFRETLLAWGKNIERPMPWKGIKNPYHIWLSEIILQQTRVEQGLPYYQRFIERFPRVEDLATAPEDEVFKLWEGLGYYSRARNLHFSAKFIVEEYNGQFPDTYEAILALKGIGPYTAAAIASFAYNLPYAVVDGNVYRVLTRLMGIETPVDSTAGKKQIATIAQQLLSTSQPGRYNQAMMDFGAVQCTPKAPDCTQCPFQQQCFAFTNDRISEFPVKQKRLKRRDRFFHYLVLHHQELTWITQRTKKDIWQKLYEFPLLETNQLEISESMLWQLITNQKWITPGEASSVSRSKPFRQVLSHQNIHAYFWKIKLKTTPTQLPKHFLSTDRKNLSKFAFPKIIDWYLNDNSLYLNLY